MLNKVIEYTKKYHMIEQGDRIVVGVSGGADSVCLLYALYKLFAESDIALTAVHVNHGLRGEEADRDEQFVRTLCQRLGIPFLSFTCNIRELAIMEGLTEEEAGRNARYQTFLQVCEQQKCNKIAVAHNKNDSAETILFHLFRGTSIKGLTGIEPVRVIHSGFGDITIIRPLLCVERKEIEAYLCKEAIPYQIDSTNLTEDYSRNKIRNRILNYATEEINSGAVGNINEAALKLREALDYIEHNVNLRYHMLVRQEEKAFLITANELSKEAIVIQKGVIRKIMEELCGSLKDLEAKHIDAVLDLMNKQVGKYVNLPYGMIARRDYEEISFYLDTKEAPNCSVTMGIKPMPVAIPGTINLPQIRKRLETNIIRYEKNNTIPKSSCMKWFDYDKIENAVEIRTRREGDYIQINGKGGHKKLKDYFIDRKIPKDQRDSQILITDGNHIMWIPGTGDRISEKYKVDEKTTKVLLMKMIDLEENEDDR
jgi:tRNA(Ile)-lysidine synthase